MNCGTRQGGVCSPALFTVFIDDLLLRLQNSGFGCHVRYICFNAFMYADDLLLLSISISELQDMIDICKSELDILDMKINIKKSMCMRIGNRFNMLASGILIDANPIPWTNEIRYLGLFITIARTFTCNMHHAKLKFFRSINGILGKVGTTAPLGLTLSLISSNCNPILFYGLEAIRLSKSQTQGLTYPFNCGFVKLFGTFDKNVISQCQYYSGCLPFNYQNDLRCLKFHSQLSTNSLNYSPASIMFNWFGEAERVVIANKYDIAITDTYKQYNFKLWTHFQNTINNY